VETIL